MIAAFGNAAERLPKTSDHASRYVSAPTAAETRAMVEKVYAERAHIAHSITSAGSTATLAPEKAPTPAASASTPEPTMFLARFATVLGTLAPDDAASPCDADSVAAASSGVGARL